MDDPKKTSQTSHGDMPDSATPLTSGPQPVASDGAPSSPVEEASFSQQACEPASQAYAPQASGPEVPGGAAPQEFAAQQQYVPAAQQPYPSAAQQSYDNASQQPGSVPPGFVPPNAVPPQGAYQPPMPPYGYQPPQQSSGKAIAALVCGILAILFCWTIVPSVILGIVAIVLAGKAIKETGKDGKTTGAKVCGIVGIVFSVLTLIAVILFGMLVGYAVNQADQRGSFAADSLDELGISEVTPRSDQGVDSTVLEANEQAALDVATAEMDKLVAKDSAMVQEMARELDDELRDSTEYLVGGNGISFADAGVDAQALAQWMLDDMTYTVDEVYAYTAGNEADVYLTIDMRDVNAFSALYREKLDAALRGVSGVTKEQAVSAVSSSLNAAMTECTDRTAVSYYIEVEQKGGSWAADHDWYDDLVEYCFE